MTAPGPAWAVSHRRGSAAELHGLDLPEPASRAVWVLEPERPALVLGSTQADLVADGDALSRRGIDLVRRRSGGGAVLLDEHGALGQGRTRWIDLVLPRGDPLWVDDVGRSTDWLGDAWVRALAALGVEATVHRGGLERTPSSSLVCFAGLGPGEVVVGDRKVVGISQRRTRAGARFQCVVPVAPPDAPPVTGTVATIVDLLRDPADPGERAELVAHLRRTTAAAPVDPDGLVAALVAALPTDA